MRVYIIYLYISRSYSRCEQTFRWTVPGTAPRVPCRTRLPTPRSWHEKPRNGGHREHPPQDTKIVAGPSSWLTAWLELALVGWLEVRTVVERLVGLEIAWWWVFVEVSEAPPWHLAASNPSKWGCKQQPCPCTSVVSPLPCSSSADASFAACRVSSVSFLFPSSAPGTTSAKTTRSGGKHEEGETRRVLSAR